MTGSYRVGQSGRDRRRRVRMLIGEHADFSAQNSRVLLTTSPLGRSRTFSFKMFATSLLWRRDRRQQEKLRFGFEMRVAAPESGAVPTLPAYSSKL